MPHAYHAHREHQVSHRRVHEILKHEPAGAKKHTKGGGFSRVTSKTAAEHHEIKTRGHRKPKRFARGGKVKGHQTNIAIVLPHRGQGAAPPAPPMGGAPMPAPGGPPMGGPPPMAPGMPMRARGGKVSGLEGESSKKNLDKWSRRAAASSYFTGGAITGVGRLEKAKKRAKSA